MTKVFGLVLLAACLAAGCTSFKALRTATFVDEMERYVDVEYGQEEHTSYFIAPTGKKMPYKTKQKVRVTLPNGDSFVAFQTMSPAGVLYKTDDGAWEFFEKGAGCLVAQLEGDGYVPRFSGFRCASDEMPRTHRKITAGDDVSSTPRGFGRPSSGPPDSSGPRTVEEKRN